LLAITFLWHVESKNTSIQSAQKHNTTFMWADFRSVLMLHNSTHCKTLLAGSFVPEFVPDFHSFLVTHAVSGCHTLAFLIPKVHKLGDGRDLRWTTQQSQRLGGHPIPF
jgi:hypothetical protein